MKILRFISAAVICVLLFCVAASAYEPIDIRLNGEETEMGAVLVGTTTYVPFGSANRILSDGYAEISEDSVTAYALTGFGELRARTGDPYIEAAGRYIGGSECIVIDGLIYVPIRSLSKVYGAAVTWHDLTRSVDLTDGYGYIESGDQYYDADEVYWLSRIISAEAGAEPFSGKIMVGNVILNRVASRDFPDTIYGVIFDRKYGVQFTPTVNGTVYNTPTEESVIAAKLCLDSYFLTRTALYFLNPALSTNFWVPNNRAYLTTVGSHDFYA